MAEIEGGNSNDHLVFRFEGARYDSAIKTALADIAAPVKMTKALYLVYP